MGELGEKGTIYFAAVSASAYTLEPLLEVCAFWIPDTGRQYKNVETTGINPTSSCPKLRNSYQNRSYCDMGLDRHTHGHTRPTTTFPTGDKYQW